MVAFSLKNEISYTNDDLFSKIFSRTTVGDFPATTNVKNPLLDGIYHGIVKFVLILFNFKYNKKKNSFNNFHF
jgi:hypothetical protein